LDLPQDYLETSPFNQLIFTALGAIVEFENAQRRERQHQGIEAAKQKDKDKGSYFITNTLFFFPTFFTRK
jgi:DNA invertase Pin-like site-specific DNA recombinase